jgi:hypothetical protein
MTYTLLLKRYKLSQIEIFGQIKRNYTIYYYYLSTMTTVEHASKAVIIGFSLYDTLTTTNSITFELMALLTDRERYTMATYGTGLYATHYLTNFLDKGLFVLSNYLSMQQHKRENLNG